MRYAFQIKGNSENRWYNKDGVNYTGKNIVEKDELENVELKQKINKYELQLMKQVKILLTYYLVLYPFLNILLVYVIIHYFHRKKTSSQRIGEESRKIYAGGLKWQSKVAKVAIGVLKKKMSKQSVKSKKPKSPKYNSLKKTKTKTSKPAARKRAREDNNTPKNTYLDMCKKKQK